MITAIALALLIALAPLPAEPPNPACVVPYPYHCDPPPKEPHR